MPSPARHQCCIYEGSPSRHLPALVATIQQKLIEGKRCLHLDSPPMIAGLRSFLSAAGVDVDRETRKGSLILSSDQSHLIDGQFDVERMIQTLTDAVDDALRDGYDGVWATGDMTWEFGPKRDFSRLIEYECRLEECIREHDSLSGICLYHADTLPREAMLQGLLTHRSLFVNETLSRINPHFLPTGLVTVQSASTPELQSALDHIFRFGDLN